MEKNKVKSRIYGATSQSSSIVLSTANDISFMALQETELDALLADETKTEFSFPPCNAYLRRYIYQWIETSPKYSGCLALSKAPGGVGNIQGLVATKKTAAEKQIHDANVLQQKENQFKNACGFLLLFEFLVDTCKLKSIPIIGHNCMFDLMFLYRWMIGELPETFEDFRDDFQNIFPIVMDTKYIASANISRFSIGADVNKSSTLELPLFPKVNCQENEDSALQVCYDREVLTKGSTQPTCGIDEKTFPKFSMAENFSLYNDGTKFHDAGWDAYCTGCIFAVQKHLVHYLCNCDNYNNPTTPVICNSIATHAVAEAEEGEIEEDNCAISSVKHPHNLVYPMKSFVNRLFMMRSMYHMDISPVNRSLHSSALFEKLENQKSMLESANVYGGYLKYKGFLLHLSGFEQKTQTNDLIQGFVSEHLKCDDTQMDLDVWLPVILKEMIYVHWIDDNGVFVTIDGSSLEGHSTSDLINALKQMHNSPGLHGMQAQSWPDSWKVVDGAEYLQSLDKNCQSADTVTSALEVYKSFHASQTNEGVQSAANTVTTSISNAIFSTANSVVSSISGFFAQVSDLDELAGAAPTSPNKRFRKGGDTSKA